MIRLADVPLPIQRRWVDWLRASWHQVNRADLAGKLREPAFALHDASSRLGIWQPLTRTISLGVDHIASARVWVEVERTLRHEMAHQVVSELFAATGADAHGELFRRACRMLRIDDEGASGEALDPAGARVLDKIRKLLSLATSPNPHEAELAMAAASRLLLRHNLTLADAGSRGAYSYRWLGAPTGRVTLDLKLVASILQEFFFVSCIWLTSKAPVTGRAAKVLEILGRPHNLDLAEYVHDYLLATLDRLWERYRTTLTRGPATQATRHTYRAGVLLGFREHLESQRTSAREEGLVWVGDPALSEFLTARHPHTRTLARSYYRLDDAHEQGRAHGRQIRVRPGLRQEPGAGRGRLLPGAK